MLQNILLVPSNNNHFWFSCCLCSVLRTGRVGGAARKGSKCKRLAVNAHIHNLRAKFDLLPMRNVMRYVECGFCFILVCNATRFRRAANYSTRLPTRRVRFVRMSDYDITKLRSMNPKHHCKRNSSFRVLAILNAGCEGDRRPCYAPAL